LKGHSAPVEDDSSGSDARQRWIATHVDGATPHWLERDDTSFLSQSLSTPCVLLLEGAQGIYIEDVAGRRFMDFHGDSVDYI
jgi:4-aminobutyrate aminotransferase